jgi:small subunit ribosomal protein S2
VVAAGDRRARRAEPAAPVVAAAVAHRRHLPVLEEKPEPGALGADEPLADWEKELLQGQNTDALAATGGAIAETAAPAEVAAPSTEAAAPATEAPATEAPATEATTDGDAPAQS